MNSAKVLSCIGLVFCMAAASGCAFSIPDPPTATRRLPDPPKPSAPKGPYDPATEYERISPMAEFLIGSLDKDDRIKRLAADAVWRCENRLNNLVWKMKSARNTRSGITLTGGILTAVGALTTTVFAAVAASKDGADKGLDVAAVVSGSITAASSITALVGTQIEDPSNLKGLYEGSLTHYNSAYGHLLDLDTVDGDAYDSLYHKALRELNECAREEVIAKSAPAGDPKGPTTQPSGNDASAPANKARGESTSPPDAAAKPIAPPAAAGPRPPGP